MTGYSVTIKETSCQLTAKQRIAIKDTTSAHKLDEATANADYIIIYPSLWAVLAIHNEKSDDLDYENYVLVDRDGTKYVTGSKSFWSSFMDIYNEMKDEDEEWGIKVYRVESKNYKGKQFITCSIE